MLLKESGAQAAPALLPEERGKTITDAAPIVDAAAAVVPANNTTQNASTEGPPPALPPIPVFHDEDFCNPDQDYDVAKVVDDWDAMKLCCEDAAFFGVIDSDCNNMPPRPQPQPPSPPPSGDNNLGFFE
eukprot:gene5063-5304_t